MGNNWFTFSPFPHKFRRGHAVYALKLARDIAGLKAVSQNLMHANISTTDGIYGFLSDTDVRDQINGLSQDFYSQESKDMKDLIKTVKQLLEKVEKDKS